METIKKEVLLKNYKYFKNFYIDIDSEIIYSDVKNVEKNMKLVKNRKNLKLLLNSGYNYMFDCGENKEYKVI